MAIRQNKYTLKQLIEKTKQRNTSFVRTMIERAHNQRKKIDETNAAIVIQFQQLAEKTSVELHVLYESVTHLLSNIATKAETGEPIKLMHANSVGAFLAGVETIANALPTSTDETKRENTLRVLAKAGMGPNGLINDFTFPIVNLGARNESRHKQMTQLVVDYMNSQIRGEPNGRRLAQVARQLQQGVDRAMRSAAAPRSIAQAGPSRTGSSPRSI